MVLAGLLGTAICLHYGRVGFMPLDQSIVFDGGWRILSGQVPFRDFTTPSGVTPILLQAGFFRMFGVTWFAYCLHAALVNGAFCILVFALLRHFGAGRSLAFVHAVLSGIVFYTPFGVPFMDQHAFFFGLAVVLLVARARRASSPVQLAAACGLAVTAAVLALFSKQTPGAFFVGFLLLLPMGLSRSHARRSALSVLTASGIFLLGVALLARVLRLNGHSWYESYLLLPGLVGQARLRSLLQPVELVRAIWSESWAWGLASVALVHLVSLTVIAHVLVRRRPQGVARVEEAPWICLVLAELLLFICAVASVLSKNEAVNSIPYVFVALGLAQLGLGAVLWKGREDPAAVRARRLVGTSLILVALFDAWSFNARVNVPRAVHGLAAPDGFTSADLPPALSFMDWRLAAFYEYTAGDLAQLVAFLRVHGGNIFVVGDTSILYGLAGRPSVSPVLWLHPRLTFPGRNTLRFPSFDARVRASLARWQVRYVIVEKAGTFMGVGPAHLPALSELVRSRATTTRSFGGFELIDLGPEPASPPSP